MIVPILVVVLLLGVVLVYVIKNNFSVQNPPIVTTSPAPTTFPMSNWKTYTNEKYGYTIMYPPTLYISLDTGIPSFGLVANRDLQEPEERMSAFFNIAIFDIPDSTLEEELKHSSKPGPNTKREMIQINGKKAFRSEEIRAGDPTGGIGTLIESGDNVFLIILLSPNIDQDTIDMYDQMVSTIEFSQ